jgi:glutamate mutase epsilon subunit
VGDGFTVIGWAVTVERAVTFSLVAEGCGSAAVTIAKGVEVLCSGKISVGLSKIGEISGDVAGVTALQAAIPIMLSAHSLTKTRWRFMFEQAEGVAKRSAQGRIIDSPREV